MEGDLSEYADVAKAAQHIAAGRAIAVDNDMVHALWGDGANPQFRDRIAAIKGSEANKPFGLTLPNDEFLEYVDTRRLAPHITPLFENPERLTSYGGALIFWRLPARKDAKDNLPSTVWSLDDRGMPIIQNWSPEGKANITRLLLLASEMGVEYAAATSLNNTREPEITEPELARTFAKQHGLPLLSDRSATHFMSGSYPVVIGDGEGLHIARGRPKAIGSTILSRLLYEFNLNWQEKDGVSPGWDCKELTNLRGPEVRSALLSLLGWEAIKSCRY